MRCQYYNPDYDMVSMLRQTGRVPSDNEDDGQCKRKATRNVKTKYSEYNLCGHCARGWKNCSDADISKI